MSENSEKILQPETSASDDLCVYRQRKGIRLILACATVLAGIANMFLVIYPRPNWDMLLGAWTLDMHHGVIKLLAVNGFFLLMLSYGLVRGKQWAWRMAVILLLLSALLRLFIGGQLPVVAMTGVLMTLLVARAHAFRAKSDPPSVRRGYVALLVGLSIVLLYSLFGLFALYNQFESLVDRVGIVEVLLRLLTNKHLPLMPGSQAFFFGRVLPMLCLSAVLYGIVMILRPVAKALFPTEQQREAVSTLARLYGRNSISYFAQGQDKAYFFTASGTSVVSYVLEGNVAVVAGDPIGPPEEMLIAIQQFLAFCQEQDWRVVFWQTRDVLVELYRTCGLHVLKIGEDAIITTGTFTLAGKAMANVRSSAKRAEKEGINVIIWRGGVLDAGQLAQMEQISRTWLASKDGAEMGFSMGRFDAHGDAEQVYALAVDNAGKVHAFVSFVPIYGRNGWGLDLMRRAEQAAPGTMERLLACSIEYLRREGAAMVSLGLAPLSDVNCADYTFLETGIDFLTHQFGNQKKNRSLFNFKKKFQPQWESRYLVYSSTLTLPKVGLALYRAHQRDVSLLAALSRALKARYLGQNATHENTVGSAVHSASGTLVQN